MFTFKKAFSTNSPFRFDQILLRSTISPFRFDENTPPISDGRGIAADGEDSYFPPAGRWSSQYFAMVFRR